MIRAARLSDVMGIVSVLRAGYEESIYVEYGAILPREAQKFVSMMIQRMGDKSSNATLVWVAENAAGVVCGVVMAVKQPVYFIGSKLCVQEIFFYGMPALVERNDMVALFRRFMTWADQDERVVEQKVSSSDIFNWLDWRDLRPFYERRGFKCAGEVFVRRMKR